MNWNGEKLLQLFGFQQTDLAKIIVKIPINGYRWSQASIYTYNNK